LDPTLFTSRWHAILKAKHLYGVQLDVTVCTWKVETCMGLCSGHVIIPVKLGRTYERGSPGINLCKEVPFVPRNSI
ncbi:hypothetical protein OS493_040355, partial [Desmophyllum pertusum]